MSPRNSVETHNKSPMAEAIHKFRLENGWSQKDLAKATGVDPATISRYENKVKGHPDILPAVYLSQFKTIGLDLSKLPFVTIATSTRGKRPRVGDVDVPRQGTPVLPQENPAETAKAAIRSALSFYTSMVAKETEVRDMHQSNIERLTREKESIVALLMEEATKPEIKIGA